jgi:hypothetical protein
MAQVNIGNIKTQIKSILDTANTTTASSPIDLSNGLDTRVQQVLKIHPLKVPVDPGSFPWVSMYLDSKEIEQLTMGHKGSQASALRQAELIINIACAVQEPLITTVKEDQGDENCEQLMENIEEILRTNSDLNSSVDWCFPDTALYHDEPWDERNFIRGAILPLRCKVFY